MYHEQKQREATKEQTKLFRTCLSDSSRMCSGALHLFSRLLNRTDMTQKVCCPSQPSWLLTWIRNFISRKQVFLVIVICLFAFTNIVWTLFCMYLFEFAPNIPTQDVVPNPHIQPLKFHCSYVSFSIPLAKRLGSYRVWGPRYGLHDTGG
jgi:hypothetical protein